MKINRYILMLFLTLISYTNAFSWQDYDGGKFPNKTINFINYTSADLVLRGLIIADQFKVVID